MKQGVTDSTPMDTVLRWLFASDGGQPVDTEWVPGATKAERARLAALGGLVGALIGSDAAVGLAHPSLNAWLTGGPEPPEDVILAGKNLLSESPDENLASLYSQVVSGKSRRTLGTFFTPPDEVTWMVDQWRNHHGTPEAIIDVGAGVGIFTTVAAQRWPGSQVWAVDINPVTLGLLALRVYDSFPLRALDVGGAGLRLVLDDFTEWMGRAWDGLPGGRLILGNPPYTRLQLLPTDQRERLWEAAKGLCGRRASLSALITAMSLQALGPSDGLCLLLPAQWLESDYARPLRERLWALRRRRVELHLFDDNLFKDAQVDAVALMVGPEQANEQPIVFSGRATETLRTDRQTCPRKWRPLFDGSRATSADASGPQLADVLTVRRGAATGANEFFVMQESRRQELGLSSDLFTPLVRRLSGLPTALTEAWQKRLSADDRYWLLTATAADYECSADLRAYVESGEAEPNRFDQRHLCRTSRSAWYDLTSEVQYPDLVIGQSTKDVFRIVEVRCRATLLNNLYGMKWKPGFSQRRQKALIDWLRSDAGQTALMAQARTQGVGLRKIEPRALLAVRLPDQFRLRTETLL